MKKNLKMMAVLSAAAVMTVAAPEMGFTGGSPPHMQKQSAG